MKILIKIFSINSLIYLRKLILHFSLKISGYKNFGSFYDTGEDYLLKQLKKYKIKKILDIGAHVGNYSKKLLENKDVNIIAFEPMKKPFLELKKIEKKEKGRFRCFNIALSNIKGKKEIFYTNSSSQLSSIAVNLNRINFLKEKKIKKQTIQVDTLDNFAKKK